MSRLQTGEEKQSQLIYNPLRKFSQTPSNNEGDDGKVKRTFLGQPQCSSPIQWSIPLLGLAVGNKYLGTQYHHPQAPMRRIFRGTKNAVKLHIILDCTVKVKNCVHMSSRIFIKRESKKRSTRINCCLLFMTWGNNFAAAEKRRKMKTSCCFTFYFIENILIFHSH